MQQERRFSDEEINLIKATFKDNPVLLKAIRKFILQLDMPEREEVLVRTQIKGDVLKIVKKCFLPEIDGDAPIMQTVDLWLTLNFGDKSPDIALLHIKARGILITCLRKIFDDLAGLDKCENYFSKLTAFNGTETTAEEIYVNLLARNTIAMHVEQQLNQLNVLANEVQKTPESLGVKRKQNSTK